MGRMGMKRYPDVLLTVLALCLSSSAYAAMPVCESEQYYAPSDHDQEHPLRAPHREFAIQLRKANSGDLLAQRNVAVSYDAGYLVDKCPEKARYWYGRAASRGDEFAKTWMARSTSFERIRQGPECGGASCPFDGGGGPQTIELYSSANGHFTAPVSIKGVTVDGVVDTGADLVALSSQVARQMGISYENGKRITLFTANGTKNGYLIVLESVRVGNIVLKDVTGTVSDGDMPLLLGMSFLGRLNVNINQGRMTLSKP
jgi:clan AA aspartic protease (TIGR02281 family)